MAKARLSKEEVYRYQVKAGDIMLAMDEEVRKILKHNNTMKRTELFDGYTDNDIMRIQKAIEGVLRDE